MLIEIGSKICDAEALICLSLKMLVMKQVLILETLIASTDLVSTTFLCCFCQIRFHLGNNAPSWSCAISGTSDSFI